MTPRLLLILLLAFCLRAQAQTAHTPKAGSAERQAICDGARAYVLDKYVNGRLRQALVFKVDHLLVTGDYANLEATPIYKDGSYIDADTIPDIGYNFCLQRSGQRWRVIADLSRSDVPEGSEIAEIRARLGDFPLRLFSPDWQKLLGR